MLRIIAISTVTFVTIAIILALAASASAYSNTTSFDAHRVEVGSNNFVLYGQLWQPHQDVIVMIPGHDDIVVQPDRYGEFRVELDFGLFPQRYTLSAVAKQGDVTLSATFEIQAYAFQPMLQVSEEPAALYDDTLVTGRGYAPNSWVDITFDYGDFSVKDWTVTNEFGGFEFYHTISPMSIAPGEIHFTVRDDKQTASAVIAIAAPTATATTTDNPAVFTIETANLAPYSEVKGYLNGQEISTIWYFISDRDGSVKFDVTTPDYGKNVVEITTLRGAGTTAVVEFFVHPE